MNFLKVFVNLFQFDRTNWKAVALCVLAASVFWIFNAFNKEYTTTIRFPLRFDYNHNRFVPVGELPRHINLNVNGNGWDLFRKSVGLRLPELVIPLDRPTEVQKIVGSTLPPLFSNQVGSLQINYVLIDTLRLQVDERDSHTFRLFPVLDQVSFREGFGRTSPAVILPDSVTLEGPRSLLHQLPDSIALLLPSVRLNDTFREELEIRIPHSESLKRNPPVVSVMFEVGPVEIVKTWVRVLQTSLPLSVKPVTDSIKMTVRIPAARKSDFSTRLADVRARINLKRKLKGVHRLYPQLTGLPDYAEVVALDSLLVKFN